MRKALIGCLLLCALVALLRHTKGAVPDNLLYTPFQETFLDVQNEFQRNDLLYSKYGFSYRLAGEMCRSERTGMADYCNLEHLILQLNVLQTNWRTLRNHEDRRFIGGNADVNVEQYLEALDLSAQLNSLVVDLKVGINMILETTVAVAQSLGSYFSNNADFDVALAEADTAYINGQLDRLNEEGDKYFGDHEGNLADKASKILSCTIAGLSLQMTDEIAKLSVTMMQMCNPLAQLFGGFDINSYFDRVEELFDTSMNLDLIIRFQSQMEDVRKKLNEINTKFNSNSEYLRGVMELFEEDGDLSFEEVMEQADLFIQLYNDYTPAVTQQDLVEVLAMLTYMMEETCSIVDELSASSNPLIIAAIASVKKEAQENCMSITVDLAVLDSFYNQIYEFQFDLMDSLAATMKGKVAVANANNFLNDFDTEYIDLATTAIGLVMDSVSVQSVAHSYCSIIEYERAGVRPSVCQRFTFTPADRQSIKSLARPDCIGRNLMDPKSKHLEPDWKTALVKNKHLLGKRDIDINRLIQAIELEQRMQEQQYEEQQQLTNTDTIMNEPQDDCTTSDFAYLPTMHVNSTGKQFINVTDLLTGNTQYITLPNDEDWLRAYGWLDKYEEVEYEKTYFVKRLQLFVPGLACKDPSENIGAEIETRNGVSVRLHIEDEISDGAGVPGYMMKQLRFPFKWDQRFDSCNTRQTFRQRKRDGTEIGTVDVCVRTSGLPPTYDNDLYPSMFTTWEVKMKNTHCELTIPDIENYDFDITVYYEMAKWKHEGQSKQCWPNPCQAGGICKEGLNTYECECPESTSGKNCENGIAVPDTCDRTYNVAAYKPTGMYITPEQNRKFSHFAVDGDSSTCAMSKETYTPWFYVELPWHAVLCEVRIEGELPTDSRNQVKVAVSKNKPSGNMFTQLNDSFHAEDPKPSSNGVYTVGFSPYLMTELYRYLVIYEPDSRLKSQIKICDLKVYSNNGAFNVIGQSSFNNQECDWSTNILASAVGTPTQISTNFNGPEKAIDNDLKSCSKTQKYTDDTKPWWKFNFNADANQICGLKITLPEFVNADEAVRLWAGFYYSDEILEPGEKIHNDYFRPCGEEMILEEITTDILTSNCDVLPMNGTQLMIYSKDVNIYLSLCDVQVFAMKDVEMVQPGKRELPPANVQYDARKHDSLHRT